MSLSQGYPSTFSTTQQTHEVLHNLDNETKKIYNDVNNLMNAGGHAHTGSGTDGAQIDGSNIKNADKMPGVASSDALLDSTGYGIISGGNVTFSGMTYSVDAIKVHMPSGKPYTIPAVSNQTITTADTTNPRIDLIYISSAGVLTYLAGTPASSPVAPTLPNGGISVHTFSVAASATSISNDTDTRIGKPNYQNMGIVNVKDAPFFAKGDGVTDDTAALRFAALVAAGGTLYIPKPLSNYRITGNIPIYSNTKVIGDGSGSVIKLASGDISGLNVTSKSNVVIKDLKILCETSGTTPYVAGIYLYQSSFCIIDNVEIVGMSWVGTLLYDSNNCIVHKCRYSGWLGTINDSSDICIYNNSNYNIVSGNHCYGGGYHGIFVQDPYSGATPIGNIIDNNYVSQHNAYGIVIYVTSQYNTQTTITNNNVRDIQGTALNGTSGAGIYVQSACGTIVKGNHVSNCCVKTSNFDTLGMAGISVTNILSSQSVLVENNNVYAQRGPCVCATTCSVAVSVSNNSLTADNSGTGTRGSAVYTVAANNINVHDNQIDQKNVNYEAINMVAPDGTIIGNIQFKDNIIKTVALGIYFNVSGTGTFSDVQIKGNRVFGGSGVAISLQKISSTSMTGNSFSSSGVVGIISNCTKLRASTNKFYSTYGSYSLVFSGANTGSIVDETNELSVMVENDANNGTIIAQYGNTSPASGIHCIGDRVIQSVPTVGQPKGWRCTVDGNPGTWISEGNLQQVDTIKFYEAIKAYERITGESVQSYNYYEYRDGCFLCEVTL